MQPLISDRQTVLESGLLGGLWSIEQFNKTSRRGEPVLPSPGFLTDHPEFYDKSFRDLDAFRRGCGRRLA